MIKNRNNILTYYQIIVLTLMALGFFYKFIFTGATLEAKASQNFNNIISLQVVTASNSERIVNLEKTLLLSNQKLDDMKEDMQEIKEILKTMKK